MARAPHLAGERGAILVQTVVAMTVMFGLGAFVFDYGVFWVSRAQAQNAADAAAVAGAIARAYDDLADPPDPGGVVALAASAVAHRHKVWIDMLPAGAVVVSFNCPGDLSGGRCVRVDVHRDDDFGNPLPTVFGPVLGITSQGVRATATAQVKVGDTTTCLKPWAIPDKWVEHRPVDTAWAAGVRFERYAPGSPIGTLLAPPLDAYTPPGAATTGTGLTIDDDPEITLTFAPDDRVFHGWLRPLDLPGGKTYEQNMESCNARPLALGQQLPISATATEPETTTGWADLIALDPSATFDSTSRKIGSSGAPGCAPISPRLVAIAAFDVDAYEAMRASNDWSGCPTPGHCVRVANIVGFFIDHVESPGVVVGYITSYPGFSAAGNLPPPLLAQSSFLKAVTLVR